MPEESRVCLLCGRPVPAQSVELEPLEEPAPGATGERVVADARGSARGRRGLVAIGAAAVVLLAVVWLLAGGGDDGDDGEAAVAPTTAAPTTTERASSSRPPITRRPTTTTPSPSPVVGTILPTPGPVLGEPTGGLSLYVASGTTVTRLELDTGRVTALPNAFRGGGFVQGLVIEGGALHVVRDNGVYTLPLDLSSVPTSPTQMDGCCWYGTNRGFEWVQRDDGLVLRETMPDGTTVRQWKLTTGGSPLGPTAVVGDELVISTAGRIFLVSTDGSVRHYAIGDYITSRGEWIMWRSCDERLRCSLNLGDRERPRVRELRLADDQLWANPWGVQLAPDGGSIVAGGVGDQIRLFATDTGRDIAAFDSGTRVDWTPDGAWAFGGAAGGRNPHRLVIAASPRDGRVVEIELPFTIDSGNTFFAVG